MKYKIRRALFLVMFFFLASMKLHVCAAGEEQEEDYTESMMGEIDFMEIQNVLDDFSGGAKLNFKETVTGLMSGETELSFGLLKDLIGDQLLYEINYNKSSVIHIIMIAVMAAIFTNFSSVFKNQQTSEVSFYIIYLLLITILVLSFETIVLSMTSTLEGVVEFTKVLAPAYFLAMTFAKGTTSALVFYNLLLFAIYLVNWLILHIVIPLVNVYVILVMVNHLSKEDFISKFADLIKTIIEWILKTVIGLIIGLNIVQGLLAPAIDSLKTGTLHKAAEAIPGIGNTVGAVTDVILGSAVLIKNGIGVAALIIVVVICAVPVLKLVIFTLMYKFAAAVIQPISDRRMLGCIAGVSEGANLLLKVMLSAAALFLVTIAIVTASTT